MAKVNVGSTPSYNTIKYEQFKGVDFSKDPSLVNRYRSPDGLNMISDEGGNPVKRRGWEVHKDTATALPIDNLWHYKAFSSTYSTNSSGTKTGKVAHTMSSETETVLEAEGIVASVGGNFHVYGVGASTIHNIYNAGVSAGKHCALQTKQGLMVFGDSALLMFDGSLNGNSMDKGVTLSDGSSFEPYVPTILIGCASTGGGTAYEGINLLTREVKETFFQTTAGNTTFVVSLDVNTSLTYSVKVDGVTAAASVSGRTFTVSSAPAVVADRATVEIQYYATGGGSNPEKICKAKYVQRYAEGSGERYFICEDNSNIIRYSELNDYTYWPDLNYMTVGDVANSIMGFMPVNSYLGVIKEANDRETTLYFISQTTLTDSKQTVDSNGNTDTTTSVRYEYKVEPAASGIGAISRDTFCILADEPLFLSSQGVHGIVSNTTTSEKAIRKRSLYLNGKLLDESNLENAVACIYKGYYVLVVNSHAYILDSRQKTTDYSGNTSYSYEGYYWDNVPAVSLMCFDDQLYFGTADGKICRFKYTGELEDFTDNGEIIPAVWGTCYDNDGYPQYLKTMQKKGSSITVKPFEESSVEVWVEVDGNNEKYIGSTQVNIWSGGFANIDFVHFQFDTRVGPREKYINKKVKKYQRMRIIAKNNQKEPFGIFGFTKTFQTVKYTK